MKRYGVFFLSLIAVALLFTPVIGGGSGGDSRSSTGLCTSGQYAVQVNESSAGALTQNCLPVNWSNLAGFPAACTLGQYITHLGVTPTCSNVPDVLQSCSAACTLNAQTEAFAFTGSSAFTATLPSAVLVSYWIMNQGTVTMTLQPDSTSNSLTIAGTTYTQSSGYSVPSNYQVFVWSDGSKWYGMPDQIRWSSLTGFPSACASNQYVSQVGASLTCSQVSWSQLTGFPSGCSAGSWVQTIAVSPTCSHGETRVTSSITSTSGTYVSTTLTASLSASTNYNFFAYIYLTGSSSSTTANFEIHALASGATLVIAGCSSLTSSTAVSGWVTAVTTAICSSNIATGTGKSVVQISGTITVGSTATTLQIDFANPAAAGTLTLEAGSFLNVSPVS